jgi:glycosyltransferase involved in cell wall biosynthesis
MKITIISNYFTPEIGAAPKRISDLALGLSKSGHDIEVICPLPNYPQGEIFQGYRGSFFRKESWNSIIVRRYWISPSVSKNPILRSWSMFSFAVNLFFEIPHLIRRTPDFIIVQNSPLFVSFVAIIISKIFVKSKIVLNISDLWPSSAVELHVIKNGSKMHSLLLRIEKFNYKYCHAVMGQSQEILDHVSQYVVKQNFLYRNLSYSNPPEPIESYPTGAHKIIYAGLLGVAQGLFDILKNIDLEKLNVELHVYGDGNERIIIEEYLFKNPHKKIAYKGVISHSEMMKILPSYLAALVPLKTRIRGAVPSKIFELATAGVPILFSGGGEGERIVNDFSLGLTSDPDDYPGLQNNINKLITMQPEKYLEIKKACIYWSKASFNFDHQMRNLNKFLGALKN